MKVAIQGVAGAFHDEAARKFFNEDIELSECSTFRRLCEEVDCGAVDFGMMAIENTIAGSLLQNYGYLDEFKLKIIGEVYLRIRMNLMALPGVAIEEVKYVFSHPIALRQCGDYLYSLPRDVRIIEADDTAESAKRIAEEQLVHSAAVAGEAAAKMYGLEIIKEGIETIKQNYTRFIALAKDADCIEDCNKASLAFEVRHATGSLAETLMIFARNNVNLTKIQSVPILGKPYRYSFHVDVEWQRYEDYSTALSEVLRTVSGLSVYGEYRKGTMP
jgi:prephenate dehydratase